MPMSETITWGVKRRRVQKEVGYERRALAWPSALSVEAAAVQFDDVLGNRKANAEPTVPLCRGSPASIGLILARDQRENEMAWANAAM